ncbi:UNVERIFIED_CONTAM: hypothetical protein K2H54_025285 [Gekko kuhli]
MGSVKGNIGHTESAAGAAGLIKVLLMMHYGKIVPSLHFLESTSSIDTQKLNLSIPTHVEKWEESSEFGRVAGVNCFGFGGTNAHVVVRQVKQTQSLPPIKRPVELFVLSAASGHSLKLALEDTARRVNTSESITLPNLAYTSACRRSHLNFKYRKAFVVSSLQDLEQQLLSAAEKETISSKKAPELIFVFSGNGLNFPGICKILLRTEPIFREKCLEIKQLFQQLSPTGMLEVTESGHENLKRPEIAQPLLFILQVALVTLLQHWGVKPTAVIGHSVGEVAAAHCAGFISLEDAVKVIYHRSRLQAKVTGGRMLVVGNIPVQEVSEAIGAYSGKVCIAAFNSPQSCTLSGDAESINAIQKDLSRRFDERDVFLQVLNIPVAYRSYTMDPVLQELVRNLSGLKKGKPEINLISTVTGKVASDGDFVTGSYWARQATDPVLFAQAITISAKDKEHIVYVEIGPHRALHKFINETLGTQTQVFPALQLDKEYVTLLTLIKDIFELGLNVNWHHFYESYQNVPSPCPNYQFDHKNFMPHLNINQEATGWFVNSSHPLIHKANLDNTEFTCSVSQSLTPYLYEHNHHGVALVPGAFFVELALAAVLTNSTPKIPLRLCEMNITFITPCILNEDSHDLKIKVESQKTVSEFRILSGSANIVCASGKVTKTSEIPMEEKSISLPDIFQRCRSVISEDKVYEALSQFGFHYGPAFKQLSDVLYCEELKEAVTTVKVKRQTAEEMSDYYIHPMLLDCFLQMAGLLATVTCRSKVGFPSGISSLAVARSFEEEMVLYLKTSSSTEDYVEFCGGFIDNHGFVLAELKCVRITFVKEIPRKESDLLFENRWEEITSDERSQNLPKAPRVVVFADKLGIAQQLKNYLHSESRFVMYQDWDKRMVSKRADPNGQDRMNLELQGYHDVLFMWGIQKLNETLPDKVLKYLVRCCEAFRQVVTALQEKKASCSVTIITHRTSGRTVDHINPGFGLHGLARTCMVEVPESAFQIIDISSTSTADISALADVLVKYKAQHYPEVWINEGRIYSSEIRRTQIEATAFNIPSQALQRSESCLLYTSDPYKVNNLSAKVARSNTPLGSHSVEVQTGRISIHSEDYFPVSISSCNFGKTLYWNSHAIHKHKLLMLDFSGTVTAVGGEVKKIKQDRKSEIADIAKSYFNCISVQVAVLQDDLEDIKASDVTNIPTDSKLFKQNVVYLVTGGLTGLGFETVKFVAQNGGGHIAILSCTNPDAEMQKEINNLQDQCECCRIVTLQCNVAFSSEVEKVIKLINKFFPNCPVKGVFHSAMVLHDGYLDKLTMSDFEEVLKPKVAGAINLHCATLGQTLDHFVCYSSLSSLFGNATQSNYAAANSFLDLFCHYRRNSGLSGQSINWGALNLDAILGQRHLQSILQAKGIEVLQVNEIHEYLKKSLILNNPQQAVAKFNFHTLASYVLSRNWSLRSRLYNLVSEETSNNFELTGETAAGQNNSPDGPENYMISLLNSLCDTTPGDLSMHSSLTSLGLDSMLALMLQKRVFVEKRVEIPLLKILDPHSTLSTLILHLKENLNTSDSHVAEEVDDNSWL